MMLYYILTQGTTWFVIIHLIKIQTLTLELSYVQSG